MEFTFVGVCVVSIFGEEGYLLVDDDTAEEVDEGDAGWWEGGIVGGPGDVVGEVEYVG